MQNNIIEFVKNNLYIILGVLCIFAIGGLYLGFNATGPSIVSGDYVIYTSSNYTYEATYSTQPIYISQPVYAINYATEPETLIVHVAGQVNNPGIVSLPYGSRIYKALNLAGGPTEYADLTQINLAAFLQDAMQIIVPTYGEEAIISHEETPGTNNSAPGVDSFGLVNINTATHTELQILPGIGPQIAQNIIDFREASGGFTNVNELINVSRIGTTTLERLRPLVIVK